MYTLHYAWGFRLAKLSIALIKSYQNTPTSLHDKCRFNPTCSEYAALAIQKYGFIKGWRMAVKRITKCRPPNGGEDFP